MQEEYFYRESQTILGPRLNSLSRRCPLFFNCSSWTENYVSLFDTIHSPSFPIPTVLPKIIYWTESTRPPRLLSLAQEELA